MISEAGIAIPDRSDTYYVADLAVTCAPREAGRRMVAEPVLIVEVLSPSTSQVDRFRKVADYRALPSVLEILVVFSDERRVELQRRGADGWRVEDLIGQATLTLDVLHEPDPARRALRRSVVGTLTALLQAWLAAGRQGDGAPAG